MDSGLLLSFRLTMCGTQDYSRYRVLGKIQLAAPNAGCNPGLMRNYLSPSIPLSSSSIVTFGIPSYLSSSECAADACQIHMRYLLLDTLSGYRSQYQHLSTLAIYSG